jgi:hypothetical protein
VIIPVIILAALVCIPGWGQDQTWNRVAKLFTGDSIQVLQKDGHTAEGKFQGLTPESLALESRNQVRSITLVSIKQVSVRRKASRWKAAGIGGAIGFGIAFPIGAVSANYFTDQNSPRFSTRAGAGAALGVFGAGIGGGLGAIAGGSRYETVYRIK